MHFYKDWQDRLDDVSMAENTTTISYNDDFSGDIQIKRTTAEGAVTVALPFWQIKELVAAYVLSERMKMLEDADPDLILGL